MKQVTEFADKYGMLPSGGAVICAISGGADSVCLLHILKEIAPTRGFDLYAVHFNHCLRGAESDRDELFVRELCRELDVELFCGSGDVKGYAEKNGLGIEEAARILRYRFFEETAGKIPKSRVATAHNADDNAETVLMTLARGAGLKGLCGIPPVRDIYIRPLLDAFFGIFLAVTIRVGDGCVSRNARLRTRRGLDQRGECVYAQSPAS